MTIGPAEETPPIVVRWRQLSGTQGDVEQTARDLVETVTGHIQRRLDVPVLLSAATAADRATLNQVVEPLTYVEAQERFLGLEWTDPAWGRAHIVTSASTVEAQERLVRVRRRRIVSAVNDPAGNERPRAVHLRPGRGGLQRRRLTDGPDPLEGIDEYGEVLWWAGSGDAKLGLIELDPEGNAVGCLRLSGDDRNETLIGQARPTVGLANRVDEITLRYLLIAIDMSGARDVWLDRSSVPLQSEIRDDMLQVAQWIDEGWLEHLIWRDPRRMVREILPGELILRHCEQHRIGMWFCDLGRKIDYTRDRTILRFFNVVSAEDRDNTNRALQTGRVNKGPLVGVGWGPVGFGFYRDKAQRPTQDMEQWPWVRRLHDLADALGAEDPGAWSIGEIERRLTEEGCPLSSSQISRILRSDMYVTGEYVVNVRGIPVVQNPIPLVDPVPVDQALRIREIVALRQGKSSTTALGECLLNYVDAVHGRCAGQRGIGGAKCRIRASRHVHGKPTTLQYRHNVLPASGCCKSGGRGFRHAFSWDRDQIDPLLAAALRELAEHPEVRRQAALAARHTITPQSRRLAPDQRASLELQLRKLEGQLIQAADEWIDGFASRGDRVDLSGYQRLAERIERKITALQTRLERDAAAAREGEVAADGLPERERIDAFLEIMTVETPTDPLLRQLRARLFQRVVHRVVIDDEGEGPITITLEGHLIPEAAPLASGSPVLAAADLLDAYNARKRGEPTQAERRLSEAADVRSEFQTDSLEASNETVSHFYARLPDLETGLELHSLEQGRLEATGWRRWGRRSATEGVVSWVRTLELSVTSPTVWFRQPPAAASARRPSTSCPRAAYARSSIQFPVSSRKS